MRVLVIGGTGFIGTHVVRELLAARHDVVVFHRGRAPAGPRVLEVIGDRRQFAESTATLHQIAPDVVVDVILSSGRQAHELMRVCRGHAGRVVALSSMDVYRACGVTHRLEDGPLEPLPLKEETSARRTRLQTYPPPQIQMLQQVFGWLDEEYDKIPVEDAILGDGQLPGTILRLPMVYGPRDPLRRFYPIVKRVMDGRRTIPMSADMAGWRGARGYVENVAAAVARAVDSRRAAGRVYNVGDSDTLTELEWAREIAHAMEWDGEFKLLPDDRLPPHLRAPGNTAQHWVADTTRIREELGVSDAIDRREAVRRTVAWERTHSPAGFSPHQFDYRAEDEALRE